MAPVLPLAPLERARLYPPVARALDALPQPRVLLFVGMAGSGKTVASRHYLQQVPWPAVVIEPHAEQDRGWAMLQAALAALGLPSAQPAAAITDISQPVVFAIDPLDSLLDEHGNPIPEAAPWLSALLANPAIHLALTSRVVPRFLELALLTANAQLQIIDGQALAFQPEEAQALWRLRQGQELACEQAEELIERSGGHAATVALACATGRALHNGHASFQEILAAQVLAHLPDDISNPLQDLAILETVSPALIEALGAVSDGESFLHRLHGYGLLNTGTPPRLHPLVRQVLLSRLRVDRGRFISAARHAIAYLSNIGDDEGALRLARAAEQWPQARQIILNSGLRLRQSGQSHTLLTWIEGLPPGEQTSDIVILLARAMSDIGDYDGAVLVLSELRARASDPEELRAASLWLANILLVRGEVKAADELVLPYLNDALLSGVWRAYALRVHAIALMHSGEEEQAFEYGQQALLAIQALGDRRLLAGTYHDVGLISSRSGRTAEAETYFRFAERCWRELGSPPDMSLTLNALAMAQLARGNATRAMEQAQESRLRALAGGRLREASIASATCGDASIAQGKASEAIRFYQIAAEEAERSATANNRVYSLAFLAHAARLCKNRDYADRALSGLMYVTTPSVEIRAWRATGIAAAHLALGLPPDDQELQQVLELLGSREPEVRGALLILGAQVVWAQGNRRLALARWAELEELVLRGRGGDRSRLAPLASCEPALLRAAVGAGQAPFAELVRERFPAAQEQPPRDDAEEEPILRVRVLGAEEVTWHGRAVTLPKHGLALLVLLLTSAAPLEDDELIRLLWGDQAVSWETLKKLVQRIRSQLPDVIRRFEGRYTLALPRTAVDFDLDRVLTIEISEAPADRLRALAESGRDILGAELESGTWRDAVREMLRRRLALIWLELGQRAATEGAIATASEAFAQAQRTDPTSDLIARAAMQSALELGDRALAMQIYLRYRHELDEQLGVDPARDLQDLYRQAMEP